MTKKDKRIGRRTGRGGGWGKGELRGGDVPSRRVSPCILLSYEGSSIRVGLKDRGKRERCYLLLFFLFLFFFCSKRNKTNYCVSQCSWLREVGFEFEGQ